MDILYAPWREDYTTTTAHGPQGQDTTNKDECVFCVILKDPQDNKHYILTRTEHCFVILNKFPYNGGHLLILPQEHKGNLTQLDLLIQAELMHLISVSITALEKELNPAGFNVGLNMGKAAGAGIPSHLHFHVLPRWIGDTNFLPTLSSTKTVSTDLNQVYYKLKPHFVVKK